MTDVIIALTVSVSLGTLLFYWAIDISNKLTRFCLSLLSSLVVTLLGLVTF